MNYQTAKIALNPPCSASSHAKSEAVHRTASVKAKRPDPRRAVHQALLAQLARLITLVTLGKPAKAPERSATLLGCDPRILDDLGISTTPFGGLVLNTPEGQGENLLAALSGVTAAPIKKPASRARGKAAVPAVPFAALLAN